MRAFPGLSVCAIVSSPNGEDEEFAHACGYSNLDQLQAMKPDSLLRIASISKPVTAMGIMRLVDDGHLKLTDTAWEILQKHEPSRLELEKYPVLKELCQEATVQPLSTLRLFSNRLCQT